MPPGRTCGPAVRERSGTPGPGCGSKGDPTVAVCRYSKGRFDACWPWGQRGAAHRGHDDGNVAGTADVIRGLTRFILEDEAQHFDVGFFLFDTTSWPSFTPSSVSRDASVTRSSILAGGGGLRVQDPAAQPVFDAFQLLLSNLGARHGAGLRSTDVKKQHVALGQAPPCRPRRRLRDAPSTASRPRRPGACSRADGSRLGWPQGPTSSSTHSSSTSMARQDGSLGQQGTARGSQAATEPHGGGDHGVVVCSIGGVSVVSLGTIGHGDERTTDRPTFRARTVDARPGRGAL